MTRGSGARAALFAFLCLSLACAPSMEERLDQARTLAQQERFEEMVPLLTPMHYEAPGDAEVSHLYGLALLRTENSGMAVWPLRVAANAPGREIESGLLLAQALAQGSVPVGAIDAIDRVLELAPNRLEAWTLRARVNQSLQRYEDALGDCGRILEIEAHRADAVVCRVESLASLGRFEEASQELSEAVSRLDSLPGPRVRLRSRFCRLGARLQQDKGDIEEAARSWEECAGSQHASPELIAEAVRFFDEAGREARGTEILEAASTRSPARLELVDALAERLQGLGRDEEAERLLLEATEQPATARAAWFALAEHYRNRDAFQDAVRATERAFVDESSIPVLVLAQHADDLIQAGDFERANEIIEQLPDHPMVHFLRGRIQLLQDDAAAALDSFEQGLLLWPGNPTARYLAGQAAERLGEMDRAKAEYRDAVRADVAHTDAALRLAEILEAEGEFAAALMALGHRTKALPEEPEPRISALRIGRKAGRGDVISESLEVLSQLPDQRVTFVVETATNERILHGPRAAADSILQSGLDLDDPAHSDALAALVAYLAQAGDAANGLRRADTARRAHPSSAALHEIHATAVLASGGTPDEAEASLRKALDLDPDRPSASSMLAWIHAQRGDLDEALELYDHASERDPEEPSHAWAAVEIAVARGDDGDVDRRLRSLLAEHPIHVGALVLEASRLLDGGRALTEAERLAVRAVRFGGGASALILRARIAAASGDRDRAMQVLDRVEAAQPRRPSVLYELGSALGDLGESGRARAVLRRALDAGEFPEAADARRILAGIEEDDGA